MKEYIAPQAKVISFDNDYVAAAPGDNRPDHSNDSNRNGYNCGSSSNQYGSNCGTGGGGFFG